MAASDLSVRHETTRACITAASEHVVLYHIGRERRFGGVFFLSFLFVCLFDDDINSVELCTLIRCDGHSIVQYTLISQRDAARRGQLVGQMVRSERKEK